MLVVSQAGAYGLPVVMIFWGKTILSPFISGDPKQTQQGLGDTVIPMMSGVAEFVMRVGVALLLPLAMGENGIFYAEITAWTGAAVLLAVNYYRRVKTLFT